MPTYYVNGRFIDASEAVLPVNDLAVLRGFGAFDYLRTYGGKPFRLMANIQRLRRSCALIYLDFPWTDQHVYEVVTDTVQRNALPEASIRIVVTGGISPDHITPSGESGLLVMVTPLRPQPEQWYTDGAKVITIRMDRIIPGAKSINYIPAIMAQKHARDAEAIEALYLDTHQHVLEGTTTNLFAFIGDTLVTPVEPILPGITREVILEVTRDVFPVALRSITRRELLHADEVFITASNKQVVPIVQVDDARIGAGTVGERTRRVMALFQEATERAAIGEPAP